MPATSPDIQRHPLSHRIPALDGVRGVAALSVMFYHLLGAGWSSNPAIVGIQKVVTAGWVGVDLFFVLSGFLITGILLDAQDSASFFKTFYSRRILRIFPLYYLVLFLAIGFPGFFHLWWNGTQWIYLAYLRNNVQFFRLPPSNTMAIQHFWTLALEEQFYLAWPLIIYFCRQRTKLLAGSLLVCAAVLALRIVLWAYGTPSAILACATPCRLDALLIGSCLALGLRLPLRDRLTRLAPVLCWTIFAALLIGALVRHNFANEDPFVITVGFTLLDVLFAALILVAIQPRNPVSRLLKLKLLRWTGTYSYGLYVYHEIVKDHLSKPIRTTLDAHYPKLVGVLAAAIVVAVVSFAVALLSYHCFEMPFLRLKRFFPYKKTQRRSVAGWHAAV